MKYTCRFLCSIFVLALFQSCLKSKKDNRGVIIDQFTYGTKYNWREDYAQSLNGEWIQIKKGNTFSWLSQKSDLQKSTFALYSNVVNIKTNFYYVIQKDSVFAIKLVSDTVYFIDANNKRRTDLVGHLTYSPDTLMILRNVGITPNIFIRYKLEK